MAVKDLLVTEGGEESEGKFYYLKLTFVTGKSFSAYLISQELMMNS